MGFFADAGPLRVFISQQLMGDEMKFDANSNPPSFVSDDQVIQQDTKIRLKIVGCRVDATDIVSR